MTDRQTDEVHVEITRQGLANARPNNAQYTCCLKPRLESSGMVQWLSLKVSYIAYVLSFVF